MLDEKINKEAYDALHEVLQSEYKQDGDNYIIQVEGMKTQSDIDAIKGAKDQAKREQKEAQDKAKELEREKNELADKVNAYESDKDLKLSKEQLVEFERLKRENETVTADKIELESRTAELETEISASTIKAELSKAAVGIIREEAISDTIDSLSNNFVLSEGKVLTNSDLGDKSGLEAKAYLSQHVEGRSYLKPTNSGGGAGGEEGSGGGSQANPALDGLKCSQEVWDK